MNEEPNIKFCPHCGGPAVLETAHNIRANTYYTYVRCTICNARGKSYTCGDPDKVGTDRPEFLRAVAAWNMRTTCAADPDEIEEEDIL